MGIAYVLIKKSHPEFCRKITAYIWIKCFRRWDSTNR